MGARGSVIAEEIKMNCIELPLAQVGQWTEKVDCWVNSEQKHRWVDTALLDIKPRLRRLRGYRFMLEFRSALVKDQKQPQEVA